MLDNKNKSKGFINNMILIVVGIVMLTFLSIYLSYQIINL